MVSTRALMVGAGVAGAGLLALYVSRQGLGNVAASVGAGAVHAVGGAASGAVGAIGQAVGLPTPAQTSTDPQVARWLIDNFGQLEVDISCNQPLSINNTHLLYYYSQVSEVLLRK